MLNIICDSIGLSLWILFIIWVIRCEIRIYREEKKCKDLCPDWGKKPIPVKFEIRKKICTHTHPFVLNEKESIICNFPCDGICKFKSEI